MHIWTNTFTKHSKCYKMGCIGPAGLHLGLYKSVKVLRHLCFAQFPGVRTDFQNQNLSGPEPLPQEPLPQAPFHVHGARSNKAYQRKEKKRSVVLQVSIVQHLNTKSKKAPYGRGANMDMGGGKPTLW